MDNVQVKDVEVFAIEKILDAFRSLDKDPLALDRVITYAAARMISEMKAQQKNLSAEKEALDAKIAQNTNKIIREARMEERERWIEACIVLEQRTSGTPYTSVIEAILEKMEVTVAEHDAMRKEVRKEQGA